MAAALVCCNIITLEKHNSVVVVIWRHDFVNRSRVIVSFLAFAKLMTVSMPAVVTRLRVVYVTLTLRYGSLKSNAPQQAFFSCSVFFYFFLVFSVFEVNETKMTKTRNSEQLLRITIILKIY